MITAYEKSRLEKLAQKAGIKIPKIPTPSVVLSRKEVKRIERAFSEMGSPLIIVKKRASIRVYTKDSYKQIGVGLTNLHKNKTKSEVA